MIIYAVQLPEKTVKYWHTGWSLRLTRLVGVHLVGATLFEGIVIQPRMGCPEEVPCNPETSAKPNSGTKSKTMAKPQPHATMRNMGSDGGRYRTHSIGLCSVRPIETNSSFCPRFHDHM